MEVHKLYYLKMFISLGENLLNKCIKIVEKKEEDIRMCYAEPISLSSNDFVQMILVDSVFVIEILRRRVDLYSHIREGDEGYFYREPHMLGAALRDIKLEENQLPYFILEELYHAAKFKPTGPTFIDIACSVLGVDRERMNRMVPGVKCHHLLDLIRYNYKLDLDQIKNNKRGLDPSSEVNGQDQNDETIPTITVLYETNVKFRAIDRGRCSSELLQINFDRGIMRIPKRTVTDQTESEFRNIVAFEQCHYLRKETYFSDYVNFLDKIINTPEDVRILAEADIIDSWLGSNKEVCAIINSLGKNVELDLKDSNYRYTIRRLINHSKKKSNRNLATLNRTYFGDPWAKLSVCAGTTLLLLTIAQTLMTFIAYFKPPQP